MSIIFFGTPQFAVKSLEVLFKADENISLVITRPDKPRKRGKELVPSPVKLKAQELKLPLLELEKFTAEVKQKFYKLKPEFFIVVAFGKIFPEDILRIPDAGCINVHASLLPAYRGAAPIQWAIINNEKITGITTMFMNKDLDAGDILLKEEIEISNNDTFGTLTEKLAKVGAEKLLQTINDLRSKKIIPQKQSEIGVSYAPSLKKEIEKINWNQDAEKIKNIIRALNPSPGAYTFYKEHILKIWKTKIYKNENNKLQNFNTALNGEVVFSDKINGLVIKCGKDLLSLEELQFAGKKKLNIKEFLNGCKIKIGERFT